MSQSVYHYAAEQYFEFLCNCCWGRYCVLFIWGWAQGWCRGESTRLPPMWSGFKSRPSQHLIMSVEFKVGYLHCYERFSSRYSGFPSKTNTSKLLTVHVYFGQSGTLRHIKTSSQELRSERNLESHFHLFKYLYLYFSH